MIFKRHRTIYVIYCLLVIIISLFTLYKTNSYTVTIISISTIPIIAVLLVVIGISKVNKPTYMIGNIKLNGCIKSSKKLLDDCISNKYIDYLNLLISQAYYVQGNIGLSKQYLLKVSSSYNQDSKKNSTSTTSKTSKMPDRIGFANKFIYLKRNILLSIHENNLTNTETYLKEYSKLLEDYKIQKYAKDADTKMFSQTYTSLTLQLNMANENFDGCQEYFESALHEATLPLAKIYTNYILYKIYIHNEEVYKAKECLTYIINNASESYYLSEAQEELKRLN